MSNRYCKTCDCKMTEQMGSFFCPVCRVHERDELLPGSVKSGAHCPACDNKYWVEVGSEKTLTCSRCGMSQADSMEFPPLSQGIQPTINAEINRIDKTSRVERLVFALMASPNFKPKLSWWSSVVVGMAVDVVGMAVDIDKALMEHEHAK